MITEEEQRGISNANILLVQLKDVYGVHNRLNIIKELFNILLLVPTIIEKNKRLRNILSVKITEFRENEIARADNEFINISNVIIGIISRYNDDIDVNVNPVINNNLNNEIIIDIDDNDDNEDPHDDYYMMYQCERF